MKRKAETQPIPKLVRLKVPPLYEVFAVKASHLKAFLKSYELQDLCVRAPGQGGVNPAWATNQMKVLSEARYHNGAIIAMRQTRSDTIVAFALCTFEDTLLSVPVKRIAFVHLVCSSPTHPGAGGVILRETEEFATRLGASIVMLQSVRSAMGTYTRKGYVRGLGLRTQESLQKAREKYAKMLARPDAKLLLGAPYIEALNGEYYPYWNKLKDTVAMFKQLPRTRANMTLNWAQGTFRNETRTVLGTYIQSTAHARWTKLD